MKHIIKLKGFTLLELMIVVAIIGILAAIAYPSYLEYLRRGWRAEARTAIMQLLQQQERYMTQRNTYLGFNNVNGTVSALAGSPALSAVPFKIHSGDAASPGKANYLLDAQPCAGVSGTRDCIRVRAVPNRVKDPKANILWAESTGAKGCTGTASNSDPKLCWP